LRVLCAYYNYPQLSATYVEAEIQFLRRHGINVEVWSETEPGSAYTASCRVHRGSLREAELAFRPDVLHFYWVKMLAKYLDEILCPHITVRSHSFETEWPDAAALAKNHRVKAFFLFPHQIPNQSTDTIVHNKIVPLSVAYDSVRFPFPSSFTKQRDLVVCCTAGLPKKTLEVFLEVATLCPELRFVLGIATCAGHEQTITSCLKKNDELGRPAEIHVDLPHQAIPPLLQQAGIYLCTQGAGKRGMPIAVAEALASGCHVLIPDLPWLKAMIGQLGDCYSNAADAAARLRTLSSWSGNDWAWQSQRAAHFAAATYADERVLPRLLAAWTTMLK
jgi:hypothetical protein